jgi:hypothetical protein
MKEVSLDNFQIELNMFMQTQGVLPKYLLMHPNDAIRYNEMLYRAFGYSYQVHNIEVKSNSNIDEGKWFFI